MTWVFALAGFCALIVLHELGHFLAAKAVGMRVERFSLFFPPKLLSFKWGETEYQLGALPLGGYVKITGMTAEELATIDPIHADRAYYNKAPWKRIVVILAGPAMNLLLALLLFSVVLWSHSLDGAVAMGNLSSQQTVRALPGAQVVSIKAGSGARGVLKAGDQIVRVEGHQVTTTTLDAALRSRRCAGATTNGCAATTPVSLTVIRGGRHVQLSVTPHYYSSERRMLFGVTVQTPIAAIHEGVFPAVGTAFVALWDTGITTVTHYFDALVSSKVRRQLQSAVGITEDTQEAVAKGPGLALVVLGLVSLVLAVVNLFPFLPLDGGHIVWALAEKIRGKRISVTAMWRYSSVGVILLAFLVINGISNDISRLSG
jgi:regulator of sigma E protease